MTAPLTDSELDAVEQRAAASTPGPWCRLASNSDAVVDDDGMYVCVVPRATADDHEIAFIASARTDVPRLVAELRAARAEICGLKTIIEVAGTEQLIADGIAMRVDRDMCAAQLKQAHADLGSYETVLAMRNKEIAFKDSELDRLRAALVRIAEGPWCGCTYEAGDTADCPAHPTDEDGQPINEPWFDSKRIARAALEGKKP